jgi:hypothetical protein
VRSHTAEGSPAKIQAGRRERRNPTLEKFPGEERADAANGKTTARKKGEGRNAAVRSPYAKQTEKKAGQKGEQFKYCVQHTLGTEWVRPSRLFGRSQSETT